MIILDLIMPDWSGAKTYRELKRLNPDVNVLISSGYSIDGDAQRLLDEGAQAFMKKPFRMKTLQDMLSRIFKEQT